MYMYMYMYDGARSRTRLTAAMFSQRFRRDVGIAVAREFARFRLLRVPFIGVPRAVARDRHAGRRLRFGEGAGRCQLRVQCRQTSSGIRLTSGGRRRVERR